MSEPHDEFVKAFKRFMAQTSVADAMSVATGMFVSLVVAYTENEGHDSKADITIRCADQRDITIHAPRSAGRER